MTITVTGRLAAYRARFARATARALLAHIERQVLRKRWTVRRSLKLDRAVVRFESVNWAA